MLKTSSACEQVPGDVEHMIGFATGQSHLENRTDAIDASCESQLVDQLLDDAQPTGIRGLHSISQFILNGGRSNNRRGARRSRSDNF